MIPLQSGKMNGFLQLIRDRWLGPGSIQNIDFVAVFLLLLVITIAMVAGFFVWLAKRHTLGGRVRPRAAVDPASAAPWLASTPFQTGMLDFPCRWLAIRSDDPRAVQSALNLANPTACSWEEGLAEARERKLFISPPVGDWILVVGSGLPEAGDDVDQCFRFLHGLSRKLGHVQFFSANRVLQHHTWALLEGGHVVRAYAWAGQTLWHQGRPTVAELQLRLRCLNYGEVPARSLFDQSEVFSANTEKVPLLAAKWSVDPTTIGEKHFKASHGIAGELSSKSY
jgi:hypothetical protein